MPPVVFALNCFDVQTRKYAEAWQKVLASTPQKAFQVEDDQLLLEGMVAEYGKPQYVHFKSKYWEVR